MGTVHAQVVEIFPFVLLTLPNGLDNICNYLYKVDVEEQITVCGQLMGMSEFFLNTISKSPPVIFKLQKEKYCMKRMGNYSFVLEGNLQDADSQLKKLLDHIYNGFILVCGSMDNIKQQYVDSHVGFLAEMKAIWDILFPSVCPQDNHLDRVFNLLPSVELPKSSGDLFLQASNMLQSCQRRPGVLVGAVLYKSRVLCTQMSPDLTRKLALIRPELPCIHINADFPLPGGIQLITVFLTGEEFSSVCPPSYNRQAHSQYRHCQTSKFVWLNSAEKEKSSSPKRFIKEDHVHWRPSSRGRRSELSVPVQTGRLSDIPIAECEESKTEELQLSDKETSTAQKHNNEMESVSDLEEEEEENKDSDKENNIHKSVKDHHKLSSKKTEPDTKTMDKNVVIETAVVHKDSSDIKENLVAMEIPNKKSDKELQYSGLSQNENIGVSSEMLQNVVQKNSVELSKSGDSENNHLSHTDTEIVPSNGPLESSEEDRNNKPSSILHNNASSLEKPSNSTSLTIIENNAFKNNTSDSTSPVAGGKVEDSLHSNQQGEVTDNEDISRRTSRVSIVISDTDDCLSDIIYDQSQVSDDTDAMSQSFSSPEYSGNQGDTLVFKYQSDSLCLSGEESAMEGVSDRINNLPEVKVSEVNSIECTNSADNQKPESESDDHGHIWSPEKSNLHDVTLYVQGHSDTSLMLLLEDEAVTDENVVKAIFKSALPHMAELDYFVKDCMSEVAEESFLDSYSYLRYDTFFQTMKGNALSPVTSPEVEFQRLSGEMHNIFEENPQVTEMIFKSQMGSCYGNRTINDETYFSANTNSFYSPSPDKPPLSKDQVFSLDITAKERLEKTQHISLF